MSLRVRCFLGFEESLIPQVGEQFASRDVLHKDVEIACILGEAVETDLLQMASTMKGWEMVLKILYSLKMWSTCLLFMMSSFFMILTQL